MTMSNETYFEFDDELSQGFTTIPNFILNDTRLTYKAIGVYVQILQYKNTGKHKVYLKSLAAYRKDKKTAVSTAIKELEEYGYISKEYIRNEKGQMNGMKYIVRMKPIVKTIENTTTEPKSEKLISDNPTSDFTTLKIKYIKNKINKKENDVVVVSEKENELLDLYKTFKIEKRVMPHTVKLLRKYKDKFDLEVFEQVFILASEDSVEKKYSYLKEVFEQLENKGISSLTDYENDYKNFKNNKKDNSLNNKTKNNNLKLKTRYHNINQTFTNYEPDELEQLLMESQKNKFR